MLNNLVMGCTREILGNTRMSGTVQLSREEALAQEDAKVGMNGHNIGEVLSEIGLNTTRISRVKKVSGA